LNDDSEDLISSIDDGFKFNQLEETYPFTLFEGFGSRVLTINNSAKVEEFILSAFTMDHSRKSISNLLISLSKKIREFYLTASIMQRISQKSAVIVFAINMLKKYCYSAECWKL
jgi:hypothetical protein